MAVVGSNGNLPISFGTPGLVVVVPPNGHLSSTSTNHILIHYVILVQVGLALSYAAPVVSMLSSFLTSFTETEKEMVSVERSLEV